ncbi:hypothetical protein E2C01_002891 [Portunus trituberculatus]|uniref:Uncharacterized protein n=1 Tax=Portunus trituberculatus TaxID=210409 RepID=A0A5B7CKX7_PORTR|nr:hypothetical protein [Portunus trituberculatus]
MQLSLDLDNPELESALLCVEEGILLVQYFPAALGQLSSDFVQLGHIMYSCLDLSVAWHLPLCNTQGHL